jgi:signal transduction histidine kinase/CheY-like chemotaxis protein
MVDEYQRSQAVLRGVLESPPGIVIFALDGSYRYLAFNQNHARTMKLIWAVDVRVGANMLDLIGRDDDRDKARHNFDRALAGTSFTVVEEYGDERNQRRYYENVYSPIHDGVGQVIGLTVYLTDITEQRLAEIELARHRASLEQLVALRTGELEAAHEKLLHAQKLESLGVLAGGVAHDFNNLLAVMLARAELAIARMDESHPARQHVEIMRETALEARMLTKQLLGYSGKGKFVIHHVSLTTLVESMAQLLRASVRKSIALTFELCPASAVVAVDVTQIRQVLLNLVTNAGEAIGDASGHVAVRTLTVEATAEMLDQAFAASDMRPGLHAAIEVEDDGCGMDEQVRQKLFDPFFTTKFAGRGLGLAAALGIVSSHHGTILLRTAPGDGTRFTVLFPISNEPAESLEAASSSRQRFRGRGTVLVVDDEAAVRAVTAEVLTSLGFDVLQADGGKRACEIFRADHQRIGCVLLDLTMPEMTGEQTLRELRAIDPRVKVIVLTGYAEDEASLRFVQGELAGFLTKPFVQDELIAALRAAMDLRASG